MRSRTGSGGTAATHSPQRPGSLARFPAAWRAGAPRARAAAAGRAAGREVAQTSPRQSQESTFCACGTAAHARRRPGPHPRGAACPGPAQASSARGGRVRSRQKGPVVLDSSTAGAQHPRQGRALTHGPAPGKHAPLARRGRTAAFAEGRRSSGETDIPTARLQHAPRSAGTAAAAWCRWEAPLRRRRGRSGGGTERVTGDRRCRLQSITPVA